MRCNELILRAVAVILSIRSKDYHISLKTFIENMYYNYWVTELRQSVEMADYLGFLSAREKYEHKRRLRSERVNGRAAAEMLADAKTLCGDLSEMRVEVMSMAQSPKKDIGLSNVSAEEHTRCFQFLLQL